MLAAECLGEAGAAADSFASRLERLLSGQPLEAREVDVAGLALLENTRLPKPADALLFEPCVQLASPVIGGRKTVLVGSQSYMNDGGYLRGPVAIGRYCSIGRRVSIGAGAHAMAGLSTSPFFGNPAGRPQDGQPFAASEPPGSWTILMHDVWVGDGAVILPGVTIGTGAVIGANAVVTRNVADYVIVAGAPAKPIGRRFPHGIAARILASRYWEMPPAMLKALPTGNVLEFLAATGSSTGAGDFPLYRLCAGLPKVTPA